MSKVEQLVGFAHRYKRDDVAMDENGNVVIDEDTILNMWAILYTLSEDELDQLYEAMVEDLDLLTFYTYYLILNQNTVSHFRDACDRIESLKLWLGDCANQSSWEGTRHFINREFSKIKPHGEWK